MSSARMARERGEIKDREFCHVLLCSEDQVLHAEAFELILKNKDEPWGRLWLFKAYFNGVGTERDVKAALRTMHSGDDSIKGASALDL